MGEPAPVREVGRLDDAEGYRVIVGVDCDAVTLRGPTTVLLDAARRNEFVRLYFDAEREAEKWAEAHGGGGG